MSKGAGRVSGLGDSDGLCVAAHSRATSAREKGPGCRPPSPLLVRDPFTAVRRGRACPARNLVMPAVNGLNPSGLLRGHLP